MTGETVPCPEHGETVAVVRPNGFTECRACWYPRFLLDCLGYGGSHRLEELQLFGLAADADRVRRVMALHRGGRVLAAQKAIMRTMRCWRNGRPRRSA